MKTIGIDARFMLRPLRGIPLYVARLCEFLPEVGKDYMFYYFINKGFEHNDCPDNYLPRLEEIQKRHDNVRIIICDHDAEVVWEQFYLPRLITKYRINLLHTPGNRICFFPGVPTVVTIHDVIEYLLLFKRFAANLSKFKTNMCMHFYNSRMAAYIWSTYKIALRRASHVITVSHYSASDIVKYFKISTALVTAIHHGLDREFLLDNGDDTCSDRPSHTPLDSRRYVLMLGGDSHQKNPEGAIAAWSKVPESIKAKYRLKIVGFCGDGSSPLIQALHRFKLEDSVDIHGWVTQGELIEFLRSAALFLYPSRYEGFGFPPLHAMASGTPVISTNCSSIPEVLGNVGLTFDPDDHEKIACGISKILTDEAAWNVQAENGIKRAQTFDWKKSAESHMRVYEEVFGNA